MPVAAGHFHSHPRCLAHSAELSGKEGWSGANCSQGTCISGGCSGGDVPAGQDPAGPWLCDGRDTWSSLSLLLLPNNPFIQPLQKSAPLDFCRSVWARVTSLLKVSLRPRHITGHTVVPQCHPSSGTRFCCPSFGAMEQDHHVLLPQITQHRRLPQGLALPQPGSSAGRQGGLTLAPLSFHWRKSTAASPCSCRGIHHPHGMERDNRSPGPSREGREGQAVI